jgi:hypothetical protein
VSGCAFIGAMIEASWEATLLRRRYGRLAKNAGAGAVAAVGHRHRHRLRSLLGSFGHIEIEMPRARLRAADCKTKEWNNQVVAHLSTAAYWRGMR